MRIKKSYIGTILLSYLAVLLVAIIVAAVSFMSFSDALETQASEYNQIVLSQIRDALDDRIHSSNKIIYNIAMLSQIQKFARNDTSISPEQKYIEYEIFQAFAKYVLVHKSLETVSVYFPSSQHIITSRTIYNSEHLFLEQGAPSGLNAELWSNLKHKKRTLEFHVLEDTILTIGRLPNISNAMIMLTLKPNFLSDIASQTLSLEKNQVFVVDNYTNQTLFTFGNLEKINSTNVEMQPLEDYQAQGYQVTQLSSDKSNFTYYFVLSENPFGQKVQHFVFWLIISIIILGGVVVSILLAYKTSLPLRILSKTIEKNSADNSLGYVKDVSGIDNEIKRILNDYQSMQKDMEPILQSRIINSILSSEIILNTQTLDSLVESISFPYTDNYLIVIAVETQKHKSYGWKNLEIIEYCRKNFDTENRVVYISETKEDYIVVLVNTQAYERYSVEIEMNGMFAYFKRTEPDTVILTVAIGATNQLIDLPSTYGRCQRLLESQLIRFPGVFAFSDSQMIESNGYYYPLKIETQLVNSVGLGNSKETSKILNNIIIENFFNMKISYQMTLVLFFSLMGTALRVIDTLNYDMLDIFGEEINWTNRITSCNNIQEMEANLREMFQRICEYVSLQNNDKSITLIQQITDYISSNISDQNMSLATVASAFNIHPNYLSTLFKKETNENFLKFLNHLRVQAGEKLLLNSELSIADISQLSGYSTSSVFIRNFKKTYNDTPGNYRVSHQNPTYR